MSADLKVIREYFAKLGLIPEMADIYFALHAYGPQSISELSRHSGVERTRIYRIIEQVKQTHLVEVETHYKRSVFKAAPISNLQILISKKEQEVNDLQAQLEELHNTMNPQALHSPLTRVQFYRGVDGLKQMLWNQTRQPEGSENISILYENMQGRTEAKFFERWVRKCNEKNMNFRGIICDNFVASQQKWYAKHVNERLARWESRHVADDVFKVTHSTVIYGDITSYFNWKDGEIFGIEMYNQEIADSQRQFFEMLWQKAATVDDLVGRTQ
ncbi:MAG TPA: helix-turn-helix domain-containing protein [Candidatus Saccharimonadales bacterium]